MIPLTDLDKNKLEIGLYVVSTPIGNLSDITLRALNILKNSDYILCEDTRISRKLLDKYNIKSQLISNHKFNEKSNINKIENLFKGNKIISLISDAGTPCISDPGLVVIKQCIKKNIKIFSIPGPSAVTSAISISGLNEKYIFYGFFPEKLKQIKELAFEVSKLNYSLVFFISAKKLRKNITIFKKYFPNRSAVVCKEITKLYEEYFRIGVDEFEKISDKLRGEITLVLSPDMSLKLNNLDDNDKKKIRKLIKNSSIRDIVKDLNKTKKISKKEIYDFCLSLKNEK